ncbi:MAG: toll/interleukin-1 receptor domain-containing protein [Actinomycetota bacterium]|nr:toll/interleukin-1 receptor domain-containing protein [Actinomycetota bacterium]
MASYLDRLGFEVWLDTKELTGGETLVEAISDAISKADVYVVGLSPSSTQSPWVRHELSVALTLETERGLPKVLPVLLAQTDVPSALTGRLYVDISSSLEAGRENIRRFVDRHFAELGARPDDKPERPRLHIASVELELTQDTVKSYGGFNAEDTRRNVEAEAAQLLRTLRRTANGVLLNFVPVTQMDFESQFFQFPNGEITARIEDKAGELVGTVGQRAIVAVQVLNPEERKLQELISSKLESLGVSKATYSFVLEPPISGLAPRSLQRLQERYVILGWDPEHGADVELEDDLRLAVRVSDEQVRIAVETRYPFQFGRRARDFSVRGFVESLLATE